MQDMHGLEIEENLRLKQASRYRFLSYKLTRIAARASESDKAYELAVMEVDDLAKMVEDVLRLEINGDKHEKDQLENVLNDCSNDVNVVNAKGFKKKEATHQGKRRAKGRFENEISNSKRKPAQVIGVSNHSTAMDLHSRSPEAPSLPPQVIGVSNHSAAMNLCSQSSVTPSHSSQVPVHSPMMVGNGGYMPILYHPYNMHEFNMSNRMSWMPYQEPSRTSSQAFAQPPIMGFPFAMQDPRTSDYEKN